MEGGWGVLGLGLWRGDVRRGCDNVGGMEGREKRREGREKNGMGVNCE